MSLSTHRVSSGWQRVWQGLLAAAAALGLATAVWAQAPAPLQPMGSVIDVSGNVTTVRNGAPARLEFFDPVFEAQAIRLAAGATLVLTHRPSKSEYTIVGPAEVEVQPTRILVRGPTPQVRVLADYAVAALGRLATQGAARMRSLEVQPVDVDLDTVSSVTPVFEWAPAANAARYELSLQEWVNKEPGPELLKLPVSGTVWQPAAGAPLPALQWGRAYLWTVTADGVTVKKGLRTVVSADAGNALAQLVPADPSNIAQSIVYAQALEWAGARDEARRVWGRVASLRPDAAQIRRKAAQ